MDSQNLDREFKIDMKWALGIGSLRTRNEESSCNRKMWICDTRRRRRMKATPIILFALIAGLLTVCVPVFAHHGNSSYDDKHPVALKAKHSFTSFLWSNPHCQSSTLMSKTTRVTLFTG